MNARTGAAERRAEHEVVITRVFDAPRSLVFKAWTEPKHLVRWWGPSGFTLPSCALDFRPEGVFRFLMRSPEGAEQRVQGVYREIIEPKRIVSTWVWVDEDGKAGHETDLAISFAEHGRNSTKLTLRHATFESVTARDSHRSGWAESLERLAEYVSKQIER
jgi:uncharacterized protein YndB with AHSA1/START domain